MPKAYTIRDVAKEAGVGVGTASRVLNDHPSVSEHTRKKVWDAIRKLDYHPSTIARQLSAGGRALAVGIIVPFFTRHAFVGRLQGIEAALAQTDYDLILYNVETPEQRDHILTRVAREKRVDGVIIITLCPSAKDVSRFQQSGIPIVLVDSEHDELPCIQMDDFNGGRQVAQHLIEIGHRHIAFLGDHFNGSFGFQSSKRRFEGYLSALQEHGIAFREEYLKQGTYGRSNAYTLTQELLDLSDPPTAIFASSDIQALGAIEAIEDRELSIPENISVVGFDDIEIAAYVGLTTVHQPLYQSGQEGVEMLLSLFNKKEQLDSSPATQVLPVELIIRNTTAKPGSVSN